MKVTIESLASGGDGVGHAGGLAVFVPGPAPGDTVEVAAGPAGQGRVRCTLERVLEPGESRVEPACPRASECGGCQWQHVSYPAQVEAKLQILQRALRVSSVRLEVRSVEPAPRPLGYRRRARLRWAKKGSSVLLGFYRPATHEVTDVVEGGPVCPVLADPIRSVLPEVRRTLSESSVPESGRVDVLMAADEGVHMAVWSREPFPDPGPISLMAGLDGVSGVGAEAGDGWKWWGQSAVNLADAGSAPFWGSAACFAQANAEVNRRLVERVARWCKAVPGGILELYAGSGNLTRALCGLGPVTAVERSGLAYRLLKKSLRRWKPAFPVRPLRSDAGRALKELARARRAFEAVVVDPPRQGCYRLLERLAQSGARRIVYVSCDPMTLGRDLAKLEESGYAVSKLVGMDTMPQTSHFEVVALAQRAERIENVSVLWLNRPEE